MEYRLKQTTFINFLAAMAWMWVLPQLATAALGGSDQNLAGEGALQPPGSAHILASQMPSGVREQTLITPQGVTVTEWSARGQVFALRWQGGTIPDLSILLGTQFEGYRAALRARPRQGLNAPLKVQSGALVAHTVGHMGAFSGSAYLSPLVPQGLNLNQLGIDP